MFIICAIRIDSCADKYWRATLSSGLLDSRESTHSWTTLLPVPRNYYVIYLVRSALDSWINDRSEFLGTLIFFFFFHYERKSFWQRRMALIFARDGRTRRDKEKNSPLRLSSIHSNERPSLFTINHSQDQSFVATLTYSGGRTEGREEKAPLSSNPFFRKYEYTGRRRRRRRRHVGVRHSPRTIINHR